MPRKSRLKAPTGEAHDHESPDLRRTGPSLERRRRSSGIAAGSRRARANPARVALALSGGGARGIAHIGALRALEEAGIPVDAIAANSMGAVVGGVYATGKTASQLEEIVRSMDWASLFSGRHDRRNLPVDRRVDRYESVAGVNFDWKSLRLPGASCPSTT